jgi:PAP_fibrillin
MTPLLLTVVSIGLLFNNVSPLDISSISPLKNKLIHASIQAWTSGIPQTQATEMQNNILTLTAELEGLCVINEPMKHLNLLDGTWRTLYSTLPIKSMNSISGLTYNSIPTPANPDNNLTVEVLDVFQIIDSIKNTYDNYIEYVMKHEDSSIKGVIATMGTFTGDNEEKLRLQIEFLETFINLIDTNLGFANSPVPSLKQFHDDKLLRNAMKLNEEQSLRKEMKYKGYSDVTYIDSSADLRIMRGAGGGLYILERTK